MDERKVMESIGGLVNAFVEAFNNIRDTLLKVWARIKSIVPQTEKKRKEPFYSFLEDNVSIQAKRIHHQVLIRRPVRICARTNC